RGHFLNWYDTRTFVPLLPRYISTVDSGNLAACLLVLEQGCRDIGKQPVVQWQGVADTLNMLLHIMDQTNPGKSAIELKEKLTSLSREAEAMGDPAKFYPARLMKSIKNGQVEIEAILSADIQGS